MKKYIIYTLLSLLVIGCFGCGNNKTKNKIMGTDVVNEGSTDALVGGEEAAKVTKELHQKKANKVVVASISGISSVGATMAVVFNFLGFSGSHSSTPAVASVTPDSEGWYVIDSTIKSRILDLDGKVLLYNNVASEGSNVSLLEMSFTNYKGYTGIIKLAPSKDANIDMELNINSTYTDSEGNTFTSVSTALKTTDDNHEYGKDKLFSGALTVTTSLGGYKSNLAFEYKDGKEVCNGTLTVGDDKLCDIYLTKVITANDWETVYSGYYIWKDGTKYDL